MRIGTTSCEALADALEAAAEIPPVAVHNDLHEAQVMVDPDGVTGLIDWQTASIELAWSLNDGWWAATHPTAPITGLPLGPSLRSHLVHRAREMLVGGP